MIFSWNSNIILRLVLDARNCYHFIIIKNITENIIKVSYYYFFYAYSMCIIILLARNLVQSIGSIETYWTNVKRSCIQWTRSVESAMKREAVRSIYPPTFPTCEQYEPIVCSSILRSATERCSVIVSQRDIYSNGLEWIL